MEQELKNKIGNDYTIIYKVEMTMEDLVNEINKSNKNLLLSVNTATKLLLDDFVLKIQADINEIKNEVKNEVNQKFEVINIKMDKILQKLNT